ncbi:MAG: ABC transporter permease [Oscillospiraceae bacterium]|jgi:cell division transport system permease protein|nr:ABC transporter permease [Oscillospiraceae bacterium]
MRGTNFSYLVKQGVSSVWKNSLTSFASFCILTVSLLLIGLSLLFSYDIAKAIGSVESKNEILVFVSGTLPETDFLHIGDVLNSYSYSEKVTFKSREEALEDYKAKMGEEYFDLFDALGENPMPYTYVVTLNDVSMTDSAAKVFEAIDGVEKVSAPYDFAKFLTGMRNTLAAIGSAILIGMVTVSIVIVYNTTKTSVFARRQEIFIMKYFGATNAFVRLPFFVEGMFIGLFAGLCSFALTKAIYDSVISMFNSNVTLWQVLGLGEMLKFSDVIWYALAANCLVGALLGSLGTVFSMRKHLKV